MRSARSTARRTPERLRPSAPLAERRGLRVQLLDDLRERRLSVEPLGDWRPILERAWTDADFSVPGGETGREAQRRAMAMLDLLRARHPDGGRLIVGSHGNLISLMLQALEPGVGFAFHMAMPNPAVYRLTHDGRRWLVMGGHGFSRSKAADGALVRDVAGDASSRVSRRRLSRNSPPSITACAGRSRPL